MLLSMKDARKKLFHFLAGILFSLFIVSCQHAKIRIHKAKLLDATMDPAKTMSPALSVGSEPMLWAEKANLAGSSSLVGSSCPTCGS